MSELSPTLNLVVAADTKGINELKALLESVKVASTGLSGLMEANAAEAAQSLRAEEYEIQKHNNKKILLAEKLKNDLDKIGRESSAAQIAAENKVTQMLIAEQIKREAINGKSAIRNEELSRKQFQTVVEEAHKMNAAFDAENALKLAREEKGLMRSLELNRAHTQLVAAEAYKMNAAFDAAAAKKLVNEEKMHQEALVLDRAFNAKREADAIASREKQALADVAYGQASLARQIKIQKEISAVIAQPNLGLAAASTMFAPAAIGEKRSVDDMSAALLKQQVAARAAASGHAELNSAMRELHSLARGVAGPLNAMWLTWGSLAPLLAGAAISGAIVGAVKAGSDFEMVLARIQGVSGETAVAVDHAGERFKALAENSIFGASDVATGSQILVQAGQTLSESLKTLPTVMQLAAVGELDMAKAAEIATGTMNAFGLSTKEIPGIANVLSKAADMSQTNIGEMGEAMKQASTIAQQYGVNLIDMSAGIATLAQVNIRGSAAGTAYKNMLVNLASPSEKGAKELAKLGVSAFDADGKMKDMSVTFVDLSAALKELNDADKAAAINGIFSERGAKGAINYMDALDSGKIKDFTSALTGVAETQDYLAKKQDLLNNTVGAQGKEAFNALGVAMIDAFNSSETGLLELTRSFKEFLQSEGFKQGLKDVVSGFVSLVNLIKDAIPYVAALAAGMAIAKVSFVTAAVATEAFTAGLTMATVGAAALEIAMGPVGLAIAAAGAVWYMFKDDAVANLDIVDGRINGSIDLMHKLAGEHYKSSKADIENSNLAVKNANEELRLAKEAQYNLEHGGRAEKGKTFAETAEKYKERTLKALKEVDLAQKNAQTLANKLYDENKERSDAAAAIEAKKTSTETSTYKSPAKVDRAAEDRNASLNQANNAAFQQEYTNELRNAKQLQQSREDVAKQYLGAHKINLDQYLVISEVAYDEYAASAVNAETNLATRIRGSEKTGLQEIDRVRIAAKKKALADDKEFNEIQLKALTAKNIRAAQIEVEALEASAAARLKKLESEAGRKLGDTQDKFDRRFDKTVDNAGAKARLDAEKAFETEIEKVKEALAKVEEMFGSDTGAAAIDGRVVAYRKEIRALEDAKTAQGDLAESAAEANKKITESWQDGALKAIHEYSNASENAADVSYKLMNKSINGMTDSLTRFAKTGKLSFKSLISSMIEDLIRLQMQTMATKAFSMILGSLPSLFGGGSALMGNTGAVAGAVYAANGHAFDNGRVTAFANGGAFTNSIVNSPTSFPMGVMGEAGPEAIMPLSRDSSGRLGVKASGSSSGAGTVNNIITITVEGGDNPDKTGDIISAKVVQTMKNIADQQIANSLRLNGALNKAYN